MVRWIEQVFSPVINGSYGLAAESFGENIIDSVFRNSVYIKTCKSSCRAIMRFSAVVETIGHCFRNDFNWLCFVCKVKITRQNNREISRVKCFYFLQNKFCRIFPRNISHMIEMHIESPEFFAAFFRFK